ncbi:hypothetical protein BD626DRAFT_522502 [Schizophyllum amplum]|uniref:Uncharacterized protein n=1 Tax=Schizophyllum amplum TaxID=97359 RepID=A0A550BTC5_9AGAR|nr:hypothetical protein BD626DRAFT_522502 [Auriculariopsis ampla]
MSSSPYSDPFAIELKGRYDEPSSTEVPLMGADAKQRPRRPPITVAPRRMSRDWFSYMYKRRRSWPRILYVLIGIGLMLIWIGLILAFAHYQLKSEEKNSLGDSRNFNKKGSENGEVWFLKGVLRQLDTDERNLDVQWSGLLYHDNNNSLTPLVLKDRYPGGLNMYRDIRTIVDVNVTTDQDNGYLWFMLDNATATPIGNIGIREWDAFDTDIDLVEARESVWTQPMRGYPYDIWAGSIVIATNDIGNSMSIYNRSDALALSFDGVSLADSLLNWKVTATSETTCRDDNSPYCELHIDFDVRRPGLVKFTVIAVVVINWLSTVVIFLLTGEALLLRRLHIVEGTDVLGVLFSALFALPGVRSLLPGAPPFGSTIDLVGILPNVIIVSLCTSCWAAAKLSWRINKLYEEHVSEKKRQLSMGA